MSRLTKEEYDDICILKGGITVRWSDLDSKYREQGFVILAQSGWCNSEEEATARLWGAMGWID